jgi:hypothetical protein
MAISLGVLLVPLFLVVMIYRLVLDGDQPTQVDPSSTLAEARAAAAFPVAEPAGLGGGWKTVSATFQRRADGSVLRLGYLSPAGDGVQVVQSNVPVEQLLPAELTGKARADGSTEVSAKSWQRYRARPGEQALVLMEPARTTIVIGSASESDLRTLAQAVSR